MTGGKKNRECEQNRDRERKRHKSRERLRDGERVARHAGRLSVSGLWECGKDTVVGRVPALKLESGAKRREPEPRAVWELPGAASPAHCRNMIYYRAALQTTRCCSWCTIELTQQHTTHCMLSSSQSYKDTTSTVGSVDVRKTTSATGRQSESKKGRQDQRQG